MRFDWKKFCDDYGVAYVTRGPNTVAGNLSVKCPFCGQADPSEHLGLKLDLKDPAWACWRNAEHAGRSPRRLVQKLLGCSFQTANEIISSQLDSSPEDSELDSAVDAIRSHQQITKPQPTTTYPIVQFPSEFKPLHHNMHPSRYADMFLNYLAMTRGFGKDAESVAEIFKLHYALSGEFAWRLIIPFYQHQQLLGWTGREIRGSTRHRYHSRGSKDVLFNLDDALSAHVPTLIVVEGPIDAIKIHYYGRQHGYTAMAIIGVAVTPLQIAQLGKVVSQFERTVILFDREYLAGGLPLAAELEALSGGKVRAKFLTEYKDPGDVPPQVIPQLCESLSHF